MLESIEIHTAELDDYTGTRESLWNACVLKPWCYWIIHPHQHSEDEWRELLPGLEFLRATREQCKIQEITEEKQTFPGKKATSIGNRAS